MSEASDNIENIFLCGLGFFFNPSPFFMCRVCLTQIPRLMGWTSHRSHRLHGFFLLMVLNLTEGSRHSCSFRLTQIPQISRFCFWWWEISRRLVDRSWGMSECSDFQSSHRSHRSHWILLLMVGNLTEDSWHSCSFRLTQISKIILEICDNLWLKGRYFRAVRRASVRFNAGRAKPWDLCDLCEPKKSPPTQSVRFNARRAKPCDLCEPKKSKKKSVWAQQFGIEK